MSTEFNEFFEYFYQDNQIISLMPQSGIYNFFGLIHR